jgi:hypothetical protein
VRRVGARESCRCSRRCAVARSPAPGTGPVARPYTPGWAVHQVVVKFDEAAASVPAPRWCRSSRRARRHTAAGAELESHCGSVDSAAAGASSTTRTGTGSPLGLSCSGGLRRYRLGSGLCVPLTRSVLAGAGARAAGRSHSRGWQGSGSSCEARPSRHARAAV